MTEETKQNKQLLTRRSATHPPLFELYFENGGEVPKELTGKYTSEGSASVAADSYLRTKKRK